MGMVLLEFRFLTLFISWHLIRYPFAHGYENWASYRRFLTPFYLGGRCANFNSLPFRFLTLLQFPTLLDMAGGEKVDHLIDSGAFYSLVVVIPYAFAIPYPFAHGPLIDPLPFGTGVVLSGFDSLPLYGSLPFCTWRRKK
jgi:hypothetical protein